MPHLFQMRRRGRVRRKSLTRRAGVPVHHPTLIMKIPTSLLALLLASACASHSVRSQAIDWASFEVTSSDTSFSGSLASTSIKVSYEGPDYGLGSIPEAFNDTEMTLLSGSGPASISASGFNLTPTATGSWNLLFDFSETMGSDTILLFANLAAGNDVGNQLKITPYLDGDPVTTAGWTSIGDYDALDYTSDGMYSSWDPGTGILTPSFTTTGGPYNTYAILLSADQPFNQVRVTATDIVADEVLLFGVGLRNVPEPSVSLAFVCSLIPVMARRRRRMA